MLAALLALQLSLSTDSVQLGEGVAIDQAVRATLRSGSTQNKQAVASGAERYTVQVYAGRRPDANMVLAHLADSIGEAVPVAIYFDEPQFKVFVGVYGSRLEAEYAVRSWRLRFPTAFAVIAPNQRFRKGSSVR